MTFHPPAPGLAAAWGVVGQRARAGAAGNFLRFPGLAAKYGGGIFLIPAFTSLVLIGIPICWCE